MVAVIARFDVREGEEAAFEAVVASLAKAVRAHEPANSVYLLTRNRKQSNAYTLLERYDSMADFKVHGASQWFEESFARIKPLLVSDPAIEVLEIIG